MKNQQWNYWFKLLCVGIALISAVIWIDKKSPSINVDWSFFLPTITAVSGGTSVFLQIKEAVYKKLEINDKRLDKLEIEVDSCKANLKDLESFGKDVIRFDAKIELLKDKLEKLEKLDDHR